MKWFLSYLWINVANINSEMRLKIILFLMQFKKESILKCEQAHLKAPYSSPYSSKIDIFLSKKKI